MASSDTAPDSETHRESPFDPPGEKHLDLKILEALGVKRCMELIAAEDQDEIGQPFYYLYLEYAADLDPPDQRILINRIFDSRVHKLIPKDHIYAEPGGGHSHPERAEAHLAALKRAINEAPDGIFKINDPQGIEIAGHIFGVKARVARILGQKIEVWMPFIEACKVAVLHDDRVFVYAVSDTR